MEAGRSPGDLDWMSITADVEQDAACGRCQMEPFTFDIENDRAAIWSFIPVKRGARIVAAAETAAGVERRVKYRTTSDSVRYFFIPHRTWREGNFNSNTVGRTV